MCSESIRIVGEFPVLIQPHCGPMHRVDDQMSRFSSLLYLDNKSRQRTMYLSKSIGESIDLPHHPKLKIVSSAGMVSSSFVVLEVTHT